MEMWIEPDLAQELARIGCREGLSVNRLLALAVREFLSSMDDEPECPGAETGEARSVPASWLTEGRSTAAYAFAAGS